MTLNLRKQAFQRTKVTAISSQFMNKHKVTVNQPVQTHFSVEGVQAYSPQQIAAMKQRQERIATSSQKQGEYVKVQAYQIDGEIDFGERPLTANEEMRSTLKHKTNKDKKKAQLECAKPQPPKFKASIKNQLTRANQKILKLNKNQEKKSHYQNRLQQLKQQYKKHFGNDLKPKYTKKEAKLEKEQNSIPDNEEQIRENEKQFEVQQEEGDQCIPVANTKEKSMKTQTKTKRQDQDDSFEEVQWQEKAPSVSSSRMKASTYSEKLGNAVHFLFD